MADKSVENHGMPGGASSSSRQTLDSSGQEEVSSSTLECPICLQPCVHPVELPCSHIFCFLCIKGVAVQGPNSRCAICRQSIPNNVLTHPRLKDISQLYKDPKLTSGFQWFYESRGGGWWMYDERTMQELERAFETKQPNCQVLIAGHLYEIDFDQMVQYRLNNRNLFRRIKRDLPTAEKRGIAGIRLNQGGNNGHGTGNSNNHSASSARVRRGGSSASSRRHGSPNLAALSDNQRSQSVSMPVLTSQLMDNCETYEVDSDTDDEEVEEVEEVDFFEDQDDEDDDDDMELGEDEVDTDNSDDCNDEDECRDGARAPTRRSDRSNSSSNNQTTPPSTPSGNNGSVSHSQCSSGLSGHSGKGVKYAGISSVSRNVSRNSSSASSVNTNSEPSLESNVSGSTDSSQPSSPSSNQTANIQIGSIHLNAPLNNNGTLRCILIGPSLRITVDYNSGGTYDEIL